MSDLHLGLIVIGILLVVGVYAFNRFQEYQLRRRVERRFAQPDDVLMRDPAEPASNAPETRVEPSLGPEVTEADGPAREEVRYARVGDEAPRAAAEVTRSEPARSEPAVAPAATEAPAAAASTSAIEYVCSIEAPRPIEASVLEAYVKAVSAIGKPVTLQGWSATTGEWVALPAKGAVSRVQAGLQLANRAGAVNRVQLSTLRDLSLQLAEQSGGACRCGDIDQAVKAAAEIDRFCSQVDISLGCNVVPRGSAGLAGTKVRGLLESSGFVLESTGRFVLRADDGNVLLTAEDIEGQPLSPERLRTSALAGLTLTMDVPRVSGGTRVFERMLEIARHLAHALDASVVDDNRAELTDAGLKVIRQQLKSVHAAMEAQGIPAGGALALRLFS